MLPCEPVARWHGTHRTSQFATVAWPPACSAMTKWYWALFRERAVTHRRRGCRWAVRVHSHWPLERTNAASFTASEKGMADAPENSGRCATASRTVTTTGQGHYPAGEDRNASSFLVDREIIEPSWQAAVPNASARM